MPKLELGDLETVERAEGREHPGAGALARDGYAILTADAVVHADVQAGAAAACFPDDAGRRRRSADAMFDPFEYFVLRDKDGLLKTDFKSPLGKVELPHPVPLARAERRPEDARGAANGSRHRGQHRRALRRSRRHVGREGRSSSPTR